MLLNTRQVVYWLSRDQYKQQRLSRPQHRSKSKSKFVLLFYCTNRKTAAPRSAPPFNFSLFISYFPCDSVASKLHVQIFKQWRKKEKSPFLFIGPGLPVSLSPNGPSAAEVCGNNHPPTVCSLAASPALSAWVFSCSSVLTTTWGNALYPRWECDSVKRRAGGESGTGATDRKGRSREPPLSTHRFTTKVDTARFGLHFFCNVFDRQWSFWRLIIIQISSFLGANNFNVAVFIPQNNIDSLFVLRIVSLKTFFLHQRAPAQMLLEFVPLSDFTGFKFWFWDVCDVCRVIAGRQAKRLKQNFECRSLNFPVVSQQQYIRRP